ncbi:MAG: alpha/beta hydrolase [Eubacteriales bacterium]|nr:alpha/beta hydrolase [Eubacteriales bacterium]
MRWWIIVLLVLVAVVLLVWILSVNTTFLQKSLIRLICAGNAGVKPLDYDAVLAKIDTLATDTSYESAFDNGALDVYAAKGESTLPLIVYAHGGYYVGDDKLDFTYYCQSLAARGYVVANINYQLAPEGRYPTQMLQVDEALRYLLSRAEEYRIDPANIFLGGDSAGAHLSSQMGLYYTNPVFRSRIGGTPAIAPEQLRGVILHCGYYNIDTLRATGFPMIADSVWMMTGKKHYEGTEAAKSMNTVAWLTPDYPPVFIDCGDKDVFLSQAREMIAALEAQGVSVTSYLPTTTKFPLMHEFQVRLNLPEAVEGLEELAGFLGERSK